MYAVVETGGKQYRVQSGDVIRVERLREESGTVISLEKVLLLSEEDGVTCGGPAVQAARVSAEVVDHGRSPKVKVFKKKRRKQYERLLGHRQPFTTLKIKEIHTS